MNERIAALFAGDPSTEVPSVGIELELLALDRRADRVLDLDLGAVVPGIARIAETSEALADLPHVAFEPGGQVELNPPPAPTAAGAIDNLQALRSACTDRLQRTGIELLAIGLDPWHAAVDVPLQLHTDRYRAMITHYARIGPAGRRFMLQTASTQICVGMRPGPDGRDQWHAANLVAPLLAAAFANAPFREGRPLGDNGGRTAVSACADRDRHRVPWVGRGPAVAYAELAQRAAPISAAYAGPDDVDLHLTTLFPPVRPRGTYLEVRSVDSLSGDDLATAVVLTAALLASPGACRDVLAQLPISAAFDRERWTLAAGAGIRHPALAAEVTTLVDIASRAARHELPVGYLPSDADDRLDVLRSRVALGRAPGDRLCGQARRSTEARGVEAAPTVHRFERSPVGAVSRAEGRG